MKRMLNRRHSLVVRSMAVTLFMITLFTVTFFMMGEVYKSVEKTVNGTEPVFFHADESGWFTFFEKDIYFPVVPAVKKVFNALERYSPGIIKLLGFAKSGVEELVAYIIL